MCAHTHTHPTHTQAHVYKHAHTHPALNTHRHVCTHMHTHIPPHTHVYTWTNTYILLYTHTGHVCTHTHTYIVLHTHRHVCTHTHTYILLHTDTHTNTHKHTQRHIRYPASLLLSLQPPRRRVFGHLYSSTQACPEPPAGGTAGLCTGHACLVGGARGARVSSQPLSAKPLFEHPAQGSPGCRSSRPASTPQAAARSVHAQVSRA